VVARSLWDRNELPQLPTVGAVQGDVNNVPHRGHI
jgi:hypothetical protein